MVKMRGGVETLGLEGLLQQLVLWLVELPRDLP